MIPAIFHRPILQKESYPEFPVAALTFPAEKRVKIVP